MKESQSGNSNSTYEDMNGRTKVEVDEGPGHSVSWLGRIIKSKPVNNIIRWGLSGITAANMVPGLVQAETENSDGPEKEIVIKGEMPSQNEKFMGASGGGHSNELTSQPESLDTINQIREYILNESGTEPLSTKQLEMARIICEEKRIEKFETIEAELRAIEGAKEERVPFGARVLYCHRNSDNESDSVLKFQNFFTEDDVISYVKGGENDMVLCDSEGKPQIWMVVADEKIEKKALKGVKDAIKWYKDNKMTDIMETSVENGLSVLFIAAAYPGMASSGVWLNEWGLTCLNQNYENTKKLAGENWRFQYIRALWVEPYGIRFWQMSKALNLFDNLYTELGMLEVVKSLIAGYVAEDMRDKDKDGTYALFADAYPESAINFAKDFTRYGVEVNGPNTKKLVQLMAELVRIPGFGNLKEVITYNKAMENW